VWPSLIDYSTVKANPCSNLVGFWKAQPWWPSPCSIDVALVNLIQGNQQEFAMDTGTKHSEHSKAVWG
jgi:hypothetical protein